MEAEYSTNEVIIVSTEPTPINCNKTLIVANHRVFQPDLNEHQTVFGGKILSLVDDSASISAMRLTRSTVVTATFDHINFIAPFHLNDSMCLEAYVSGTGHRSLEVFAKIIGENLDTGKRFVGFTAFITFVTAEKRETPLPIVVPQTDEQRYICSGYLQRAEARKTTCNEQKQLLDHVSLHFPWPVD
ncbi:acyl-CoA thioesterase [Levilactobacillus spicheri]